MAGSEKLTLTEKQKLALASRLPQGLSADNLRFITCRATVRPMGTDDLDPTQRAVFEKAHEEQVEAGGPAMITDGRPTTMAVVAWMAHEGQNRNKQGFIKEELELAASQISPRHQLIMDWNHSAVRSYSEHPAVIGTWYQGDFAFDPKAKGDKGAWGIATTGLMWSWKFPKIANQMLADQERNGFVEFSMACIATTVDVEYVGGEYQEWLHNPVFFTNSALDVPPADPDATGRGSESTADGTTDALREQVVPSTATRHEQVPSLTLHYASVDADMFGSAINAVLSATGGSSTGTTWITPGQGSVTVPWTSEPWTWDTTTAEGWTTTNIRINGKLLGTPEPIAPTEEEDMPQTDDKKTAFDTQLAALELEVAQATERATAATARAEEAEGRVQEAEARADAALADLRTANAAIESMTETLSNVSAKLKAIEDAKTEGEIKLRVTARFAELPKSLREAIAAKPERRERFEKRVGLMTDDEWKTYRDEELLLGQSTASMVDYVERTRHEGGMLPTGGSQKFDWASIRK